jgi:hypothetical protein
MVSGSFRPEEPEPLDPETVARVNVDLPERLINEGVEITYDEDGDTLFISIGSGEGVPAITEHMIGGLYVRLHPESLRVVGAMILRFASDFLRNNKLARIAFEEGFRYLRTQGDSMQLEGDDAQRVLPLFQAALRR